MAKDKLVEKKYLFIFILITSLFALWGFANDITNPMVAAFQTVMELSAAKASLVQFAFYGGYATMAIPAALFIRKHSYKSGILLGLALYAIGAFLFMPAAQFQQFSFFCVSLYVLTFGLAFLETTANPFILSLGSKDNATRRLNLSQSFNPMGSLMGMSVASFIVLPQLLSDKRDAAGNIIFPTLSEAEKASIRLHDLAVIRNPYVIIGLVVVAVLIIIALAKVPKTDIQPERDNKNDGPSQAILRVVIMNTTCKTKRYDGLKSYHATLTQHHANTVESITYTHIEFLFTIIQSDDIESICRHIMGCTRKCNQHKNG